MVFGGANTGLRQGGWFVRDHDSHVADVLTSLSAAMGVDTPFGSAAAAGRTPRVMTELFS